MQGVGVGGCWALMWIGGSAPDSRGTRPPAWLTRMTDHTHVDECSPLACVCVCLCVRSYARVIWTWNRGVAACGGGGRSSGTGSVCVAGGSTQVLGRGGGAVVVLNYEPFTFQSETSEGFGWEIDNGVLTSPASALRPWHHWFRWFWVVLQWINITFSTFIRWYFIFQSWMGFHHILYWFRGELLQKIASEWPILLSQEVNNRRKIFNVHISINTVLHNSIRDVSRLLFVVRGPSPCKMWL